MLEQHHNPEKKRGMLADHLAEKLLPLLADHPRAEFVYENTYRATKNYYSMNTLNIQGGVRRVFEPHKRRISIRALMPTQKHGIGGATVAGQGSQRKENSVHAARGFLNLYAPDRVAGFDALARRHDVADAVTIAIYAYDLPKTVRGAPRRR
jgi:hypothetical protein